MIVIQVADRYNWHPNFLLLPKWIGNKLIWLQTVQRRWDDEAGVSSGDFSGYAFNTGGWVYSL